MARHREPDEYQVAFLQNNLPTCVFRPKSYRRVITNVDLGNSITSVVSCYRGITGNTAVATSSLGTSNTLKGEIEIPAGQSFIIQWTVLGTSVSDAFARVTWEREDDPASKGDGPLVWSRTSGETTSTTIQLADINQVQTVGVRVYGRFPVTDLPYLKVDFSVPNSAARLELGWFTQAVGGTAIGNHLVDLLATTLDAAGTFPVLGPWVQVTVTMSAAPDTAVVRLWQIPGQSTIGFSQGHNALISVNGAVIAAATTRIDDSIKIRWGWGYIVYATETVVGVRFTLHHVDYLGVETLLDYGGISAPAAGGNINMDGHLILIPPGPLRLRTLNGGAAGTTVFAAVTIHPGPF